MTVKLTLHNSMSKIEGLPSAQSLAVGTDLERSTLSIIKVTLRQAYCREP